MTREGEARTCRSQARKGAHDRGRLPEEACEVETLMHGSAAETGGAIPSSTVTGRGDSGASQLGGPVRGRGGAAPAAERERCYDFQCQELVLDAQVFCS
jgi:hypothetical protein